MFGTCFLCSMSLFFFVGARSQLDSPPPDEVSIADWSSTDARTFLTSYCPSSDSNATDANSSAALDFLQKQCPTDSDPDTSTLAAYLWANVLANRYSAWELQGFFAYVWSILVYFKVLYEYNQQFQGRGSQDTHPHWSAFPDDEDLKRFSALMRWHGDIVFVISVLVFFSVWLPAFVVKASDQIGPVIWFSLVLTSYTVFIFFMRWTWVKELHRVGAAATPGRTRDWLCGFLSCDHTLYDGLGHLALKECGSIPDASEAPEAPAEVTPTLPVPVPRGASWHAQRGAGTVVPAPALAMAVVSGQELDPALAPMAVSNPAPPLDSALVQP